MSFGKGYLSLGQDAPTRPPELAMTHCILAQLLMSVERVTLSVLLCHVPNEAEYDKMTYLQIGIPIANLNPHETPQLIGGYQPGGQISKVGPQLIAGHSFGNWKRER